MNKGDKIICIKPYNIVIREYTEHKIYIIEHIYENRVYVTEDISKVNSGYWFLRENDPVINGYVGYFYDYFIPLAEWREQQIKTVLDE